MTDRPRLGGAYEIGPDGALRRIGGTEEPPLPGPAEADGTPIGRQVLPAQAAAATPTLPPGAPEAPGAPEGGERAARTGRR